MTTFLHCSLPESNASWLTSSPCQGTLVFLCFGDIVGLTTLPSQFGGRCKHLFHLPKCHDTCTIPKDNLCTSLTFDSSGWQVSFCTLLLWDLFLSLSIWKQPIYLVSLVQNLICWHWLSSQRLATWLLSLLLAIGGGDFSGSPKWCLVSRSSQ